VEERIVVVKAAGTGVFTVVANPRVEPEETFPKDAQLTVLAAHYEMWQIVGRLRMEWVPLSRQAEGTVALQWSVTDPGQPWTDATVATLDPTALVGTMSTTHTLTRSPRTGQPVACAEPLGYLTWAVTPAVVNNVTLPMHGFIRMTFSTVLTHPLGRMAALRRTLPTGVDGEGDAEARSATRLVSPTPVITGRVTDTFRAHKLAAPPGDKAVELVGSKPSL
jgi:hypothetical protein